MGAPAERRKPSTACTLAKGGLHALTHNLALEMAPHQIRVNTIRPPSSSTRSPSGSCPRTTRGALPSYDAFHPLGRAGTVRDIVSTITFLLSSATSWLTRAIWNVDSGVVGRN